MIPRPERDSAPLTIAIDIDGKLVTCADLVLTNSNLQCDDDRVSVVYFPQAGCLVCEPNDTSRLQLMIDATPKRIEMIARENEAVVAQQTFQPTYLVEYPLGEDWCGEGCRTWTGTLELP